MFYISDITGSQSPYAEGLFRVQREQQLAELRARETYNIQQEQTLAAQNQEALSESAGGLSTTSSDKPAGAPGAEFSPQAIAMAGGSALSKEKSSKSAGAPVEDKPPGRLPQDTSEEVTSVRPTHVVQKEAIEDEIAEPMSSRSANPYKRLEEKGKKLKPALLASQIMSSPVISFKPDQTLEEVNTLFSRHRFRHIPVASEDGKLIGIVSDRDFDKQGDLKKEVREFMVTHVLSARPFTEIRLIAEMMFKERIGAMPIVDENEKLVGMLTRSDILRVIVNRGPLELWV